MAKAILVGRKSVIQLSELVASGQARQRLQVGGRVVTGIVYTLESVPVLEFKVSDPPPRQFGQAWLFWMVSSQAAGYPDGMQGGEPYKSTGGSTGGSSDGNTHTAGSSVMPVVYRGVMPPTFQGGGMCCWKAIVEPRLSLRF